MARHRLWGSIAVALVLLAGSPLGSPPSHAATNANPANPNRGVIFVHGIHADARLPGFQSLLQPLVDAFPSRFESFAYFDDVANRDSTTQQCAAQAPPAYTPVAGFPVNVPAGGAAPFCDSEDDVGLNAVLLDQEITKRSAQWSADHITLIANSMGGAIVRAYLAYATETGSPSLTPVDSIIFLQGAQEGSWIAEANALGDSLLASSIPGVRSAVTSLGQLAFDQYQIDPQRPAIADLTPQSQMYQFDSQAQYLPAIRYANVASDITTNVATHIWWWTIAAPLPVRLGDYVMVPGFDDPTRTDWMGGERFLPAAIGRGSASTQWVLPGEATIQRKTATDGSSYWDLSQVLNAPMSHFQLGSQLAQLSVQGDGGQTTLDHALLEWIGTLDGPSPSASAPVPRLAVNGASAAAAAPVAQAGGSLQIPVATIATSPTPLRAMPVAVSQTTAFVDQESGAALVLPTRGAAARRELTFAFQVPGKGVYRSLKSPTQRQLGPTRIVVTYDGPASLGPLISTAAGSLSARSTPTHVSVRLDAEVDPIHRTADATLVEGGSRFHLVSQRAAAAREPALAAFEAASMAADWHTLYRLVADDVRGTHSEASFTAAIAQQVGQLGRIRSVRRLGLEDVRIGQDGLATFRATYQVVRQAPNGSEPIGRFTATFLQQSGAWHLWFTDALP